MKSIIAQVDRKHKWGGNILQKYAEELFEYPTKEEETLKVDMTEKLIAEILRELRKGEIVIIQVNGKPRLSKSTVGVTIGKAIHDELKALGKIKKDVKFGMQNIARDDLEYSRMMTDEKRMFDVIVTDEDNALEKTGENATVEEAQKTVFSNIHAGRYVHRVCCSPEGVDDPNADIRLEVRSKEKGISHCRLYYGLLRGGVKQWVLLGHVNIDVSNTIKNWLKVEHIFYRWKKKGEEVDGETIKRCAKKDWYIEYMCKKYEKMDLITKEKILRPRELEYAEAILNVISRLENLAKMGIVDGKIIRSYVQSEFRILGLPLSIIGAKISSDRVEGVLSLFESAMRLKNQLTILNKKKTSGKIDINDYEQQNVVLKKAWDEIQDAVDSQINELRKYMEIKKRYDSKLW